MDELVRLILGEQPKADDEIDRAFLHERVRRDFASGNTVSLDGWVLARTECRFCALVKLVEP